MAVRPIDLLFQDEVRRFGSRANEGGMYPRATYGSVSPLTQSKPISITIDRGNVVGKPSGGISQEPNLMNQSLNAGLLGGQSLYDPKTFGLLGASAKILEESGYSTTPKSTGQILGSGLSAGLANAVAMQQAQAKANQPIAVAKDGMLVDRSGNVIVDNRNVGGFSGSGITNQAFNTLLSLNESVSSGKASKQDMLKYRLAHGYLSKPQIITVNNADGTTSQIQRPAQDLSGFYNPFPNQQSNNNVVGTKPSAEQLKIKANEPKLISMLGNLNEYIEQLKKLPRTSQFQGAMTIPDAQASSISALAETLRLDIKNLYELGALVGGDFQILDNLLTSPVSIAGLKMGKDGLLEQMYRLETNLINKLKSGGYDKALGTPSDPIEITSENQYKNAQFGLYYKMPNGKVGLKLRKRN